MDDGGIIGDVELLRKVWKLLLERGPALGTSTRPNVSGLGSIRSAPTLVPSTEWHLCHSQIQMLGVPLGCDEFVATFVEKKLLGRLQSTVDKLVDFEDSQASSYLLRVSYSIVRALHADNAPSLVEGSS